MSRPHVFVAQVLLLLLLSSTPWSASALIRRVPDQYETIQLAIDDSRNGDIILVAPGNYPEQLTISRSIYLVSEEPGGAVIDADHQDAITVNNVVMFQVVGFVIHNCRTAVLAIESSGAVIDTEISGCMPVLDQEDVITFNGDVDATVSGVSISGTEATDPTLGQVGMYISGQGLIRDTTVGDSGAAGIELHGASGAVVDTVIEGSGGDAVVAAADDLLLARLGIEDADGTGILVLGGERVLVLDNTLEDVEFGVEFSSSPGTISEAIVWNNSIVDAEQAGVVALADLTSLQVGHSEILNGGSRGLWLQDPDMTALIHDTTIAGNEVLGISIGIAADGFLESSDITIRRNVIADNLTVGIQAQDSDALIANNTLVNNGDWGIYHATSFETPTFWLDVRNNIVAGHQGSLGGNEGYGIYADYAPNPCNIEYELLWDNDVDWDTVNGDPCSGGAGLLYDDPLFADAGSGDYSLLPGSPAIDAGDPDPSYEDADGSPNDLGATGGPEEATLADDEAPSFTFEAQEDIHEGECQEVRLPDGADPEGYPLFVEWEITGSSNGTWDAYGPIVRLCGEDDGEFSWTATGTDPFGNSASADGTLTVLNRDPGITSTVPTTATAGVDYLYQIEVSDPGEFDTFEYDIEIGPEAMEVDAFGSVTWTPTNDDVGRVTVKFVVRDDDGGMSQQIEDIEVSYGGPTGDDDDCSCDQEGRREPLSWGWMGLLALALLRRWRR